MDWSKEYRPERRANWEDIARAIRYTVTMEEVLDTYFPGLPRRGHRCPCPIHNGKDMNFSFTNTGYRCFVCGAAGDVVAFVKEVCELATRADAMKKLNNDLRLNLPIDSQITEAQSMELARRRAEAEKKKYAIESWNLLYNSLMDEWVQLDRTLREETDPEKLAQARGRIVIVEDHLDHLPAEPR